MSVALDVNVLLYASDRTSPFSQRASSLLAELAVGREVVCLAWITIMSYLRLATHSAIFDNPLTPDEAMRNVGALLRLPHVRAISEDEGFWEKYRSVAGEFPVRGNLVPDAHLATLLLQHGIGTLYTNDTDFRKFEFLQIRNPFG